MLKTNHIPNEPAPCPWYRLFWPWFIVAIPLMAVIMGLVTVLLAVSTSDGLVVDDYYKQGLAINRVLARDRKAKELQITALVRIDPHTGKVHMQLEKSGQNSDSEILHLRLLHPTRANLDINVAMHPDGNKGYTAVVEPPTAGKWYLHIEPETQDWRLTKHIKLPGETSVRLGTNPASG